MQTTVDHGLYPLKAMKNQEEADEELQASPTIKRKFIHEVKKVQVIVVVIRVVPLLISELLLLLLLLLQQTRWGCPPPKQTTTKH